jgi:hypothetical protein
MAVSAGRTSVTFGVEGTYGTEATTMTKSMDLVESITPKLNNNIMEIAGLGSRDVLSLISGQADIGLTMEGTILLGYPVIYAIGTATPAGSAPVVHTIAPATVDEVPSLSIAMNVDMTTDSNIVFLGCRMNSLRLKFSTDAPVKFTADFLCKDVIEGATMDTYTALVETPLLFSYGSLKLPGGGSALTEIESGELTITNNLFKSNGLGNRKISSWGGTRKYGLTMDINYDGPDFFDLAAGSNGAIDATGGADTTSVYLGFDNGGSTTGSRKMEFASNVVQIGEWGLRSQVDAALIENIKASIKWLDGDANNYVTLTNNTATM